jgi:hypothetical protein
MDSTVRYLIFPVAILLAATIPAKAVDLDEVTVVTMARDGSWGMVTAGSQGEAIAAAIRDCRAVAAAPSDCGAQLATTRGGWVVANLCGDHKIIVAGETREAAEQAALRREADLKKHHVPNLQPCRRVLTGHPSGPAIETAPRVSDRAKPKRLIP